MAKVRMMLWVLAVLLPVVFVAAGCASASDQSKHKAKEKVEAKGHQAKQEAKNKLKAEGEQATQKANAGKQEAKNKLKAEGERVKHKAEQKRGSRPEDSKKGKGY